jgi:hypothetical protein
MGSSVTLRQLGNGCGCRHVGPAPQWQRARRWHFHRWVPLLATVGRTVCQASGRTYLQIAIHAITRLQVRRTPPSACTATGVKGRRDERWIIAPAAARATASRTDHLPHVVHRRDRVQGDQGDPEGPALTRDSPGGPRLTGSRSPTSRGFRRGGRPSSPPLTSVRRPDRSPGSTLDLVADRGRSATTDPATGGGGRAPDRQSQVGERGALVDARPHGPDRDGRFDRSVEQRLQQDEVPHRPGGRPPSGGRAAPLVRTAPRSVPGDAEQRERRAPSRGRSIGDRCWTPVARTSSRAKAGHRDDLGGHVARTADYSRAHPTTSSACSSVRRRPSSIDARDASGERRCSTRAFVLCASTGSIFSGE